MSDHSNCDGACSSCTHKAEEERQQCLLEHNLEGVRNFIVVLSGKGGVGKSTVSVNLACALAKAGKRVGLLDVDVHGPSVPTMLGVSGKCLNADSDGNILPLESNGIKVVSVGLIVTDPDAPVIWRGPMKASVIRQFLAQTKWGQLDYLVVDAPPGTGDEPLSVCQMLPRPLGAIVVTTPQQVAAADVARSIAFCQQLDFPLLGIVENMASFVCPCCGKQYPIFGTGGAEKLAEHFGTRVLARLPIDPRVCESGDSGAPFASAEVPSAITEAFSDLVQKVISQN